MKSILKSILAALLLLSTVVTSAQNFEGKMTMKAEAIDLPAEMESMKSMFESTMTIYSKGNKSRLETTQPMVGEMIVITDIDKKESTVCMNMMGEKMAIVSKIDQQEAESAVEEAQDIDVQLGNLKKTICGYSCQNATVKIKDGEVSSEVEVWFTSDIQNTSAEFNQLPGMPLEYTMNVENFKLHYLVTSIEKQKVADSSFSIPEGYEVKTEAELENMFPSRK